MRLDRMADLYEQQVLNKTSQSLGFEEQLELLIDRVSAVIFILNLLVKYFNFFLYNKY